MAEDSGEATPEQALARAQEQAREAREAREEMFERLQRTTALGDMLANASAADAIRVVLMSLGLSREQAVEAQVAYHGDGQIHYDGLVALAKHVAGLRDSERDEAQAEALRRAESNVRACQGDLTRLFAFKKAALPVLRDHGLLEQVHLAMDESHRGRGYWMTVNGVTAHVQGDKDLSPESEQALVEVIQLAYDRMTAEAEDSGEATT